MEGAPEQGRKSRTCACTTHDARHTAGTLLGELHVDIHVIQRILGHAQLSTTRIYTDPTDLLTREAADTIGGLLWPDELTGPPLGQT